MNRNEPELHEPRAAEGPEMITSMRQGVVEAIRGHKSEGRPIVTWDREAGRIVEVPPEEIIIPEDSDKIDGLASKPNPSTL